MDGVNYPNCLYGTFTDAAGHNCDLCNKNYSIIIDTTATPNRRTCANNTATNC